MSFLAFYGPENQYAAQTREFLNEYNQYWRTYFDPIALRVQMTPNRYRAETIVLPLIFNSFYTGLAANLKEKPVPLDALPVAKSNIFSVAFSIPKGSIRSNIGLGDELLDDFAKLSQSPDASKMKALIDQGEKFLNEGIVTIWAFIFAMRSRCLTSILQVLWGR